MSSSKSARDNDYTSLDFLQGVHNQLSQLRTPSVKVLSQTEHNLSDSNRINKHELQNSSPIIQMHTQLETVKIIRSHSLEDAETPQLKQFKKFYDVLVNDLYDSHDANIMWAQFEASYGDFVMYEMFIDSLTKKMKRMKESIKKKETIASNVQNKQIKRIQNPDAMLNQNKKQADDEKPRKKAMSCLKKIKGKDRSTSLRAVGKSEKQKMRSKMKKQMGYILKVIKHGGTFIHS